jgi:ferric-dicitrate binding protein FerR (iron transport regulator)
VLRDNVSRTRVCAAHARPSQRLLGLLRGNAAGRFRTTGRFAAATVRGTDWGVRDRCDGTLTVVRTGTVTVRDLRLGKTVLVHAGQSYLASAP